MGKAHPAGAERDGCRACASKPSSPSDFPQQSDNRGRVYLYRGRGAAQAATTTACASCAAPSATTASLRAAIYLAHQVRRQRLLRRARHHQQPEPHGFHNGLRFVGCHKGAVCARMSRPAPRAHVHEQCALLLGVAASLHAPLNSVSPSLRSSCLSCLLTASVRFSPSSMAALGKPSPPPPPPPPPPRSSRAPIQACSQRGVDWKIRGAGVSHVIVSCF